MSCFCLLALSPAGAGSRELAEVAHADERTACASSLSNEVAGVLGDRARRRDQGDDRQCRDNQFGLRRIAALDCGPRGCWRLCVLAPGHDRRGRAARFQPQHRSCRDPRLGQPRKSSGVHSPASQSRVRGTPRRRLAPEPSAPSVVSKMADLSGGATGCAPRRSKDFATPWTDVWSRTP